MTVCTFIHSKSKRAKTIALLDSGATENFMNLEYTKYLQLPIQHLKEPRKLYNIDGTPNQSGELQYFTDLQVQTGTQRSTLRFFLLTHSNEAQCEAYQKCILVLCYCTTVQGELSDIPARSAGPYIHVGQA
jgi:hypothetical protein